MASIFTKIIAGEIPGNIVWEDDKHVALLTIQPIHEGHTLIVPRKEAETWLDMTADEYADMMKACHTVAEILKNKFNKSKVVQIIQGFEVPHVHVHLIPADTTDECPFPPVTEPSADELNAVADRIRQ